MGGYKKIVAQKIKIIKNKNMNLIQYVPRDSKGKFSNLRKQMFKILKYQLIILSLLMNVWFVRHTYVIRCSAGGMLMTQQACGDEADAKFAETQLLQTQNQLSEMQSNIDLYTNK